MSDTKKPKMRQEQLVNRAIYELEKGGKLKFAVIGEGIKIPIIIDDNKNCSILNKKQFMQRLKNIMSSIYESLEDSYSNPDICMLTSTSASLIFDTAEISERLQLKNRVQPFAFKSEDVYTFARIPFDPLPEYQPTPCWDSFTSNYTNNLAIKIWVGSLFFEDSDRSQYLWLYGHGWNGKSTLARILKKVLTRRFVRDEQVPKPDDKFWTFGLIGKRLVVFDDCTRPKFVMDGLFKSLTGSSMVRVEQKNKDAYDTELDCKFLFTSNEKPEISTSLADQRRIILCEALNREKFEHDPGFEPNLMGELGAFISNCMLLYEEYCGDGSKIPTDQTAALELGNAYSEDVDVWVEKHFEFSEKDWVSVAQFREEIGYTKLDPRRVYKRLEEKGIKRGSVWQIGKAVKAIIGLRLIVQTINPYQKRT